MRVAIVAQSVAMRLGLKELLSSLPGIEVSADAPSEQGLTGIDVLVVTSAEDVHLLQEETRPVLLLTNASDEAARLATCPYGGCCRWKQAPRRSPQPCTRWARDSGLARQH